MESRPPETNKPGHVKKLPGKLLLFLSLAILVSVGASLYILFSKNTKLSKSLQSVLKKEATIKPQVVSKNPFKKDDQFVNPFDPAKSPFYSLKTTKK